MVIALRFFKVEILIDHGLICVSLEGIMDKRYFEILLEEISSNMQLVLEGVANNNERLDRFEKNVIQRFDNQDKEIREIRRVAGLLHAIANDHEARLQSVESTLQDHLVNHS